MLRNDPLYLGLRRSRVRGEQYDEFVDQFCKIVRECYPDAFLHFEDFGTSFVKASLRRAGSLS